MLTFKNDLLPDWCFVHVPGNPPGSRIGIVRLGHTGYWPSGADCFGDGPAEIAKVREYIRKLNRNDNVTALQEDCMSSGSMFGWSCSGADPDYMRAEHGEAYTPGGAERLEKEKA